MPVKAAQSTATNALDDRINALRADISVIIDAKARAAAKDSPGVPLGVIRNLLTARAPACACAQYLELSGEGARQADLPWSPSNSSGGDR